MGIRGRALGAPGRGRSAVSRPAGGWPLRCAGSGDSVPAPGSAAERGCSFIQTWHKKDNPNFYAAIAPGLKEDFFLYHGSNAGGEEYEESEYIHLRKYLDGQSFSSRVQFGGRSQKLISPRDNAKISELFRTTSEEYPGMLVKAVSKPED